MWKNIVESGRQQMTMWRMRIACWLPNATNTHSEHVIPIAFPLQQRVHERASMSSYMYITCFFFFFLYCFSVHVPWVVFISPTHVHVRFVYYYQTFAFIRPSYCEIIVLQYFPYLHYIVSYSFMYCIMSAGVFYLLYLFGSQVSECVLDITI